MSSLAEVRDQVLFLTSRPDRKDAITVAINQLCRKLGGTGKYPQALWEATYPVADNLVAVGSDVFRVSVPARFHGVSYVKMPNGCQYEMITPSIDNAATAVRGWYVSGQYLLVNPADVTQNMLIGWFLYPTALVEDSDSNWVLDRMEHLIVDLAAAYTLTAIGDQQSAGALSRFASAFERQEIAYAKALNGE